jgi:hypothetical protein
MSDFVFLFGSTVDDGTAVIDCVHKPTPAIATPIKSKLMGNKQQNKYKRTKSPMQEPLDPVPLVPVAYVGTSVRVVGRVMRWHESRQIRLDVIGPSLIHLTIQLVADCS